MSDSIKFKSGGIGLPGLLFVLFLGLKLGGVAPVAAWSWWWVTCPLWAGLAIGLGIGLIFLVIMGFAAILAAITD